MQETGRHPVIYQLPARTWRSRLFPDIIFPSRRPVENFPADFCYRAPVPFENKRTFRILSNERDEYFTKLRMIEDELSSLKKVYQTQKKPLDRNEKLVLDRINSILHD